MDDFQKELSEAKGQRNQEWQQERLGKVTASKCKAWVSKGRKKDEDFGQTALTYLYGVIAEILSGSPHHTGSFAQTEWGEDLEEQAIERYSEETGNKVRRIGYIEYNENDLFGGSSDGLIDPNGCLEIKCPFTPANHIQTMVTKDIYNEDHRFQVQANLLFSDRKWCDYVTYDPRVLDKSKNIVIVRIERDEELITKIKERIDLISDMFGKIIEKIM